MWRIGDLEVDGRVVLGPMSGYTFRSYREFMAPFGASVVMTEMTSNNSILDNPSCGEEFLTFDRLPHTGLQIFGSDPERIALSAERALSINPDIDFIDVNMSCPVEKVVKRGAGSALMRDPAKCGRIVRLIRERVDVPVTAKIRLGQTMESLNFGEVISELESAGADMVSLHTRTVKERYAGHPHHDMVAGLQDDMSVPLVISGNIYTPEDAVAAVRVTGAAAVMIARGGVGDPFLLTQTDRLLRGMPSPPNPTVAQQAEWCLRLADMVLEEKGAEVGIRKMRSIAPKFVMGCGRCREYRLRLTRICSRDDLVAILDEMVSRKGDERVRTLGYRPPALDRWCRPSR